MNKKTLLLVLQYVIFFGLGFSLIYWQYTKLTPQDITELRASLGQVAQRWWIAFPIVIIGFLSHFFRALRWRVLLEPLQIRPSIVNVSGAVFIGYLTNLLLPRMGEVAKCTVLAKYDDQPADKIIGTIVAERGFDLICLVIISFITFAVQAELVSEYLGFITAQMDPAKIWLSIGIVVLVLVGLVCLAVGLYRRNKDGKLGRFLKGIGQGLSAIFKMKKRGQFLLYTFGIWMSYLSLIYIGFYSMEATEHLGWGAALSLLVFGSLGMIVTPGGLGAYPQAVQMVLSMIYGIKSSFGLAFGWISWLAQTIIIIIFGVLSFIILPLYNRSRNEQQTRLDNQ